MRRLYACEEDEKRGGGGGRGGRGLESNINKVTRYGEIFGEME